MRNKILLALVFVVLVVFSAGAFADDYVILKAEFGSNYAGFEYTLSPPDTLARWTANPYYEDARFDSELGCGAGVKSTAYAVNMKGSDYYNGHARDTGAQVLGVSDLAWFGGSWGGDYSECRFLFGYDLKNLTSHQENALHSGNVRTYDPVATGFGPGETAITSGWGLGGDWTAVTGPTKGLIVWLTASSMTEDGASYWDNPGGQYGEPYGYPYRHAVDLLYDCYPTHLNLTNTVSVSGGLYALGGGGGAIPEIKKAVLGMAFTKAAIHHIRPGVPYPSTVSVIPDSKKFEIVHVKPPASREIYCSADVVWGEHSGYETDGVTLNPAGPLKYYDTVVARETVAEMDDADAGMWFNPVEGTSVTLTTTDTYEPGWCYNTLALPNNYPTGRQCVTGWWLIDAAGQSNDQHVFHGAADDVDNPLCDSFFLDMVEDRRFSDFVFKGYDVLGDDIWGDTVGTAWTQDVQWYIGVTHWAAASNQNGFILLTLGPAISAEDWVLYR